MKKSFIKTAVVMATGMITLFGIHMAASADVHVEAGSYSSITFAAGNRVDTPEFSNGDILYYIGEKAPGSSFYADYKVTVPRAGAYSVTAVTTLLASKYTTDYMVSANGEEELDAATDAVLVGNVASKTYPDTVQKYNIGALELKKGENTIRFRLRDDDLRQDGFVAFYMDYFELKEIPFAVKKAEPMADLGVFEQNTGVSFDIKFNSAAPDDMSLKFIIRDFWNAKVTEDVIKVKKNSHHFRLELGTFEPGWYSMEIYNGESLAGSCTFAVVVPQASRKKYDDTPFAMDFASDWLVKGSKDNVKRYLKAAKLAGVTWLRERFRWSEIEAKDGEFNYDIMDAAVEPFKNSGIHVLNVFHDTPGWARARGRDLPSDMFKIYRMMKNVSERYKGTIDAWEAWNEQDTIFLAEPVDLYSAFLKAASLGVADSNSGARSVIGGFAGKTTKKVGYKDLIFANGAMDYISANNYHAHINYNAAYNVTDFGPWTEERHTISSLYDKASTPVWMTEAGMYLPVSPGAVPPREEQCAQAAFVAVSTAESLAKGVDKHFWFILPSYVEGGREMGLFSGNGEPYPAYCSEATMTSILGKGKYKGRVSGLPEHATGCMFDNGENDVAVIWCEHGEKAEILTDKAVAVSDIMGKRYSLEPEDGKVEINISKYPVYVIFNGRADIANYLPQEFRPAEYKSPDYSEAKHIVMTQIFGSEEYQSPKLSGYRVKIGQETEMKLDIYNFNDHSMTGVITPEAPKGYIITPSSVEVTVGAMEKAQLTFTIAFNDMIKPNSMDFLRFNGEFNGEMTSPAVSWVLAYKEVEQENVTHFKNSGDPAAYDGSNITASADPPEITKGSKEGAVRFKLKFNGDDRWFYPYFKIEDPTILRDTTGLCFSVYADEDMDKVSMNVFVYLEDGRQYYLGHSNGKAVKAGWNQVAVPWDKLQLQYSPYGNLDFRDFDTDLITKISVGCNSPRDIVPPYEIYGLGYYTEVQDAEDIKDIVITGVENEETIVCHSDRVIKISLPETELKGVKILINDTPYERYSREGNEITIDLSSFERGRYFIQAAAEEPSGFMIREDVRINIE